MTNVVERRVEKIIEREMPTEIVGMVSKWNDLSCRLDSSEAPPSIACSLIFFKCDVLDIALLHRCCSHRIMQRCNVPGLLQIYDA